MWLKSFTNKKNVFLTCGLRRLIKARADLKEGPQGLIYFIVAGDPSGTSTTWKGELTYQGRGGNVHFI